jgi:CRISPR/Cas system CMR-associated protein Cmr5 small subunit
MSEVTANVGAESTVTHADFYKPTGAEATPEAKPSTEGEAQGTIATTGQEPAVKAAVEPAKPAEAKPTDIKLSAPENYLFEASYVEEVASFAKENGLTQDVAEKILNRENQAAAKLIQKEQEAFEQEARVTWVNQIKADPELGGDNLKQTAAMSHKALKSFGSEALMKELNETGYGNHPELVRFLTKVGRAMSTEAEVKVGNSVPSKAPVEDLFYKPTNKK